MFAGHVGVGLAIGRAEPRVNVGLFVAAALLLDLVLWIFVLLGWESLSIPADFAHWHQPAYTFPYSHGLVACIGWSALAGAGVLAWHRRLGAGSLRVALLTAAAAKRKVWVERGARELGSLSDLNSNAIVDRGAIIGLWEYDPEQGAIAWFTFEPADRKLRETVVRTEAFIREQLGDARSFSLDSPRSRAPRIAAIRDAGKRQPA